MQNEATAIWTKACRHLAGILSKDVYDRWIAQIVAIGLDETTLLLSVANDFYQSRLEENYLSLIEDAVASVTGRKLKIGFAVDRNMDDSKALVDAMPFKGPIHIDADQISMGVFGARKIPGTYVVDGMGILRISAPGGMRKNFDAFRNDLKSVSGLR